MEEQIRDILSNILDEDFSYSGEDMFEDGILDSIEMMELVTDMEKEFNIEIEAEDIIPENFKTIGTIVEMIYKYKS